MNIPKIGEKLTDEHVNFLKVLSKSCRNAIVAMVANAQSGHPGGACSSIDYLATVYAFIISQTGEDIVISNGHISAGVYSILAEMGYIPRDEVIKDFRKVGKIYEGHITRHVKGITYGTGPLGIGVSVGTGFAMAEKIKNTGKRVFAMAGDGECNEGQVYEMMHYANKYKLDNYTLFIDYNEVQLTDSLEKTMPINLGKLFGAANWNVLKCNGHDYNSIWEAIGKSYEANGPTVIIGKTIMGKGVTFMEPDGAEYKSVWHGIPPKPEQAEAELAGPLKMSDEGKTTLDEFRKMVKWQPSEPEEIEQLSEMPSVNIGKPMTVPAGTKTDCRGAYGKALLDLAKLNDNIVAMSADLGGSVKTAVMGKEFPERVFEVGIAEQHMVSFAGGISLKKIIPFSSTFGVFMTSRSKDQARLNDINRTNVKMVSTHCGLSVGEDGPTHQTVDDMGSFSGFFNTHILEPADSNQTDHIIRFITSHYGNFYVRMGRHKFEVLTKEDGTAFYDENYKFKFGKGDLIRNGEQITIVATGSMVKIASDVADKLKEDVSVEVIALSSFSKIDTDILLTSLKKTGKLITIEDHNPKSGWASQINSVIAQEGISAIINNMGVREYQLSGKPLELYDEAGIGPNDLEKAIKALI